MTQMENRIVLCRFKDGYGPVGAYFLHLKTYTQNAYGEEYESKWYEHTKNLVGEYIDHHPTPTCLRNHAFIEEMKAGRGPIHMVTKEAFQDPHKEIVGWENFLGMTVGQVAEIRGYHPVEAMLDLAVETDLAAEFLTPMREQNDEWMTEMITSPYCIPGVSDGGAHTKFLTAGSYPTDFLMWLVRDTGRLSLEEAHYRLSYLPARAAGFRNRGTLTEGAPADVVVYDLDALNLTPEWAGEIVHDFPGGEWRRVQRPEGYRWILVNGEVTFQDGEATGSTPGKLLRHGRG